MKEVFVARQPIFDRKLHVAGYELLFRGGPAREAVISSPEGATAAVVLNSFTEIGLERIVGPRTAWINVGSCLAGCRTRRRRVWCCSRSSKIN